MFKEKRRSWWALVTVGIAALAASDRNIREPGRGIGGARR